MKRSIDLNCDMGEGCGSDEAIMPFVSSVNIACGYHAGDTATMQKTVRLAIEHGVAIGAHPGMPDRENFGRRMITVTPQEVYDMVLQQAVALADIARAAGAAVTHLKPHGALYNMAAKDGAIAQAIAEATRDFDPACILVGLAGSKLISAGIATGLSTASEAFADRTYQADGSLTPRHSADALIHDPAAAAERVLKMVLHGTVTSQQGSEIPLRADTICIHGDSPGAAVFAKTIREQLLREGIEVKSLTQNTSSRKPHAS
ncbi:MAG: LamB/YcsF family protein [Planctomycetales bacterium]|nr:LamB/YcsF family protein [Planctomycetales bacterium]